MKHTTKPATLGALTVLFALVVWTGKVSSTGGCQITNGTAVGCSITGGDPPAAGPAPGERFTNLSAAGLFVASKQDLHVAAPMPIDLTRVYRTRDFDSPAGTWLTGPFGKGVNFRYNMFLYSPSEVSSQTYTNANIVMPDGGQVSCSCSGTCGPGQRGTFQCNANPGAFFGATIGYDSGTSGWDVTLKDQAVYMFGAGAPLQSIHDRYGNSITVTRGTTGNITQISSSNGRYINFSYGDPNNPNQITQATDNSNTHSVTYSYDSYQRMTSSVDAVGTKTTFAYVNAGNQLGDLATAIIDPTPGLNVKGAAAYDASFRVKTLTGSLGNSSFAYTVSNGAITECDVTTTSTKNDGNTVTRKLLFNRSNNPFGYLTTDKRAVGSSPNIEADYRYTRDSSSNLITQVTDPFLYNGVNRTTAYCYDTTSPAPTWNSQTQSWSPACAISKGNITGITYAASINPSPCSPGASACTYTYTYDPKFNELNSITDPLQHTWSAVIDSTTGNVDSVTVQSFGSNVTGATWNMLYNLQGQMTSSIDPGFTSSNPVPITTSYSYNSQGDLTSTTNGRGNTTSFAPDSAGRITSVTDPLRETTSYAYDALDRITQVADPNGHSTQYYYDTLGMLTQATDANGHSQTFTPSYSSGVMMQWDAMNNEWQFL